MITKAILNNFHNPPSFFFFFTSYTQQFGQSFHIHLNEKTYTPCLTSQFLLNTIHSWSLPFLYDNKIGHLLSSSPGSTLNLTPPSPCISPTSFLFADMLSVSYPAHRSSSSYSICLYKPCLFFLLSYSPFKFWLQNSSITCAIKKKYNVFVCKSGLIQWSETGRR